MGVDSIDGCRRTYYTSLITGRGVKMRIDEGGRECIVCGLYLVWNEYNGSKGGVQGHDSRCRGCLREYRKSEGYREANRARGKRAYSDPVKREEQKARMRAYRKEPGVKDRCNEYSRGYQKIWREKNREKSREFNRKGMGKWMANPRNRFSSVMSAAIRKSLKGAKGREHWERHVDYTLDDLVRHIEGLWEQGMSWANHKRDGWHIDHVKPISAFSFDKPDDQGFKDCWALSNIMPRWATTEIAKAHGSEQIGNANKGAKH